MSNHDPNTQTAAAPHHRHAARRITVLVTIVAAVSLFTQACGSAAATSSPPNARHTVAHLKTLGLPISATRTYTAANDPNDLLGRPGQYTSKTNFRDRRLAATPGFDIQNGGSVEAFATTPDAQRRYRYVHAVTQSSAIFGEYDYLKGRVLLRLSLQLTSAQAKQYAAALNRT